MVREKATSLDNVEIRTSNNLLSNENKLLNIRRMSLLSTPIPNAAEITKVFHAIFHNSRNSYFPKKVALILLGFRFVICKEQCAGLFLKITLTLLMLYLLTSLIHVRDLRFHHHPLAPPLPSPPRPTHISCHIYSTLKGSCVSENIFLVAIFPTVLGSDSKSV